MATTPIDYTSRDFRSIRADLLERARVTIPEWTTITDPADFGALLVELWAYVGDNLNYYIDRVANEAFLETAVRRSSVLAIAQMMGYTPTAAAPAKATLTFTRTPGVTGDIIVPKGTTVITSATADEVPIRFETDVELEIDTADNFDSVTASEGATITGEVMGVSVGVEWMTYQLQYRNPYESSVQVFVYEGPDVGAGATAVEWQRVTNLIEYGANDAVFTVETTEASYVNVRFGDGVHGRIPTVNTPLAATYRYGVGAAGNVSAGSIVQLFGSVPGVFSVSNAVPATGGTNAESMESMRSSIPRSLSNGDRGVTLDDYASLALHVDGVGKSAATWDVGSPSVVTIFITPTSAVMPGTALKTAVDDYVTPKATVGKTVTVSDPTYVGINITATVNVVPNKVRSWVVDAVEARLAALFDFDSVDFGDRVRLADTFRTIVETDGVDYVTITVFSRTGSTAADVQLDVDEVPIAGTIAIIGAGGIVGP